MPRHTIYGTTYQEVEVEYEIDLSDYEDEIHEYVEDYPESFEDIFREHIRENINDEKKAELRKEGAEQREQEIIENLSTRILEFVGRVDAKKLPEILLVVAKRLNSELQKTKESIQAPKERIG